MKDKIEVVEKDVIVAGGGIAGFSAALSAARHGCEVLLLEGSSCLGGLLTAGLVTPMMGAVTYDGKKVISGNADRIFERLKGCDGADEYCDDPYAYDPEKLKYVLEEMLSEQKVEVAFQTFVHDAAVENGAIQHISVLNKEGAVKYSAKVYIDCTGDADLAYKAGADCKVGRDGDGLTQASSLRFIVGGVDVEKTKLFSPSEEERKKQYAILKESLIQLEESSGMGIWDRGMQAFRIPGRPWELGFNCPRLIRIDATKARDLSTAYLEGRKRIPEYLTILKKNISGFEKAYISQSASLLGVRESRRIQGDYVLDGDDIMGGRKFADGISGSAWFIDIHNPTGTGIIDRHGQIKTGADFEHPAGGWCDIPFRAMYSSKVENLLVAGRCASATHEALAAIRISAACTAMGEAAGTAAALMKKTDTTVHTLDVNLLRNELAKDGALITGINI